MSERYEQAAAEADRIALCSADRDYRHPFMEGVEWADANPYSTPEALAAAYEDGQRDAVEKGLAQPRTIMRAEFEKAYEARFMPDPTIVLNVLGFLREVGIEVVDDE